MFWLSMSTPEQDHIVDAFSFELSKVTRLEIRERVLNEMLANIHHDLAARVAKNIGLAAPKAPRARSGVKRKNSITPSPALSMMNTPHDSIATRKIAILAADGVDANAVTGMQDAIAKRGAAGIVLSARLGSLTAMGGDVLEVDHTLLTMPSIAFDAVFIPGGSKSAKVLAASGDAIHFVAEAYKHGKAIAALADSAAILVAAGIGDNGAPAEGLITGRSTKDIIKPFIAAIANHRAWSRADKDAISA